MTKFIKLLHRIYVYLWLKLHWRRSIDSAPEEYVKAMERESNVEADWEATNRLMRRK